MYYKVLYKITTNPDEIRILEEAVENNTSLFIETQVGGNFYGFR